MATGTSYHGLPNELLHRIAARLCDRRINSFDPVATKDLQNVRLASRKLLEVATPLLFENLVLDFSSWRGSQRRLIDFACTCPHLVPHVRRLQFRTTPFYSSIMNKGCRYAWMPYPELEQQLKSIATLDGLQALRTMIMPTVLKTCAPEPNVEAAKSLLHKTILQFPNVYHTETAISTFGYQSLAEAHQRFLAETGIVLDNFWLDLEFGDQSSYTHVPSIYTLHQIPARVTSLKLRQVRFGVYPSQFPCLEIPSHIECLEIEFCIHEVIEDSKELHTLVVNMEWWRSSLARLRQLKSLRLVVCYDTQYGAESQANDLIALAETYELPILYFDTLLTNTGMQDGDAGPKVPSFPCLESLAFINCPVSLNRLIKTLTTHSDTLKKLELCRVLLKSADPFIVGQPKQPSRTVSVADMCKSHVPALSMLRLTRIKIYGDQIIDKDWMSCHEWRKGNSSDGLTVYRPSLPNFT